MSALEFKWTTLLTQFFFIGVGRANKRKQFQIGRLQPASTLRLLQNIGDTEEIVITVVTVCFAGPRPFRHGWLSSSRGVKNFQFIFNPTSGHVQGLLSRNAVRATVVLLAGCLLKHSCIHEF
jgi:hypothetical protein